MRKINFLKGVLGVAVAMLMTVGAFGQVANSDYERYDTDVLNPDTIDYITLKTGGTTMGYYAMPDTVYHPNYVAPGWTLTTGFQWNWTVAPAMGVNKPATAPANYATITYTATGNYVVRVAEQAPIAFGGCVDATPTVMNVTVIAPPAATIATVDTTAQSCGNLPATRVELQFTEAVPYNWAAYAFAVVEEVVNLDAAGNPITSTRVTDSVFVDYPITAKLHFTDPAAVSPYSFTFNTSARNVVNANRTRYTYTLIKASDLPRTISQGLVSGISQKSDYLNTPASITKYAFVTHPSISWIVNPAPVTGPIYHIPNNFNY